MEKINNLDWYITKECDSKLCPFCYSADGGLDMFQDGANLQEAFEICGEIKNKEIEFVTLCGGEPLLYQHIEQVIKKLHSNGTKVQLNTGLAVDKTPIHLLDYLHTISLPVDAISTQSLKRLRGQAVFEKVNEILEHKRQNASKTKIKIGTVVNRWNISEAEDIFSFLKENEDVIDMWRVYMMSACGSGKKNFEKLGISKFEFDKKLKLLEELVSQGDPKFKILGRNNDQLPGYCVAMDSVGNLFRLGEDYEYHHAANTNIFSNTKNIIVNYDMELNKQQKGWKKEI